MSTVSAQPDGSLRSRVFARIGLLGNPSDGFEGAVIGLSQANFWAEVTGGVLPQAVTVGSRGSRQEVHQPAYVWFL